LIRKKIINRILKILRVIYSYIPNWYKYGKDYRKQYMLLVDFESWNDEKKREYQFEMLKKIVKHSYENINYYKKLFDENKIDPNIKSLEEFYKIPVITKEIIRKENENLISRNYNRRDIIRKTTGGTTGVPLNLYSSKSVNRSDRAFVDYYWSKIGFNVKGINKIAIIRGEKPENGLSQRVGSKLILSSYMLNEENIPEYVNALERFNPDFIHCFPSALFFIAKYIGERDITVELSNLKGILTSSETLYNYQKSYLKEIFDVTIFDFYGQSETSSIAISIGDDEKYYFDKLYAFNEQENGSIISTGLINEVMPLLRYSTEDICSNINSSRELVISSRIEGRSQDYIIGKNDEKISLSATNFHDDTFNGISEFQYEQNEQGKVRLKIVLRNKNIDLERLRIEVTELLDNVVEVTVDVVTEIHNTRRGKKRLLIQNLDFEH